jgi:zinc protease
VTLDRSTPPPPTAARPFRFGDWRSLQLDQGPRIMVMSQADIPLVHVEIIFGLGADRDPSHLRGLTSLAGGLLDEGTEDLDAIEIASTVEQLGASLETAADWDGTYVATSSLSRHLAPLFALSAEIALRPDLPTAELERLRRARLADLAHRRSQPAYVAGVHAAAMLYGAEHAYGTSLLGTPEGVARIDSSHVEAWHAERARPELTTIVAVGDTNLDEITALAGEHFARWPRAVQGETAASVAPPDPRPRRVRIIDRPNAAQTEIRIVRIGPSRSAPEYLPARLANLLLGGKFTSRLNLRLREDLGITYGVHSSLGGRRGPGPFSVSCAIDTEAGATAVGEILAEMDRMASTPPPEEELRDGKNYLLGTLPFRLQTLDRLANRLAGLALYDRPDDYFERLPERIEEVSPADVQRSAETLMRTDDLAIVAVGPAADLAALLEPFGPLDVQPEAAAPSA